MLIFLHDSAYSMRLTQYFVHNAVSKLMFIEIYSTQSNIVSKFQNCAPIANYIISGCFTVRSIVDRSTVYA